MEWASVLDEVERAVKVQASADGRKVRDFNGNSLETLAKACSLGYTEKITYLPSRAHRSSDGGVLRLKRSAPDLCIER